MRYPVTWALSVSNRLKRSWWIGSNWAVRAEVFWRMRGFEDFAADGLIADDWYISQRVSRVARVLFDPDLAVYSSARRARAGSFNFLRRMALSACWFHVEVKGDVLLLLGLSLIFLLGSLGLAILISTVSRNQIQALHLSTFVMLPAFILSGFMFPRENMPALAYYAGYGLPITYFLVILRAIIMKGVGMAALWGQVIPLTVFSLGIFVVSALAFHKRLE